ncbi:thialysine N-epsilon-acetyltransferase-like isoform X1 [Caretta caretta]|uniref:thialysine N-epsilon-acetyltransferase-like isoform X1 n=1 Tax=Caretta caretta TaxID=8467 RepID=UPI00209422D1|nr:thialysine N-epsilon-acetyltransferase-like isoform X1 [Caretta caretta]
MNCIIRPCTVKDCKVILQFIKEIAVHYRVPPTEVKVTLEVLREDGFGAQPQYDCYVAELPPRQTNKEGGIVGYVLSSFTYSTWKGRNLYVDNLYVQPQFRGQQIGKRLIEKAAQAAVAKGCGQLRMHIAKTNEMGFLARQGGQDLTAKEGWSLFHFKEDALRRLAARSKF